MIKQAVEVLKRVVNNEKKLTLDNVQEVSRLLEYHNEQLVELYMWHQLNTSDKVSIEEMKEYLQELDTKGFFIRNENLMYLHNANMKRVKEHILEVLIEEEYFIDKLFDKEELIEMWLEGTSKEEAIKDIAHSAELEELLEDEPRLAYSSAEVGDIMYVYLE